MHDEHNRVSKIITVCKYWKMVFGVLVCMYIVYLYKVL
jgi:hypothetical protein